jgi:hypothetical protein
MSPPDPRLDERGASLPTGLDEERGRMTPMEMAAAWELPAMVDLLRPRYEEQDGAGTAD